MNGRLADPERLADRPIGVALLAQRPHVLAALLGGEVAAVSIQRRGDLPSVFIVSDRDDIEPVGGADLVGDPPPVVPGRRGDLLMGALPATCACAVPCDLTTLQAATFLGVDSNSICAWAEASHIWHTLTPGGHRRFEQADLKAWRAGQRPPATQHAAEIRAEVWAAAAAEVLRAAEADLGAESTSGAAFRAAREALERRFPALD